MNCVTSVWRESIQRKTVIGTLSAVDIIDKLTVLAF